MRKVKTGACFVRFLLMKPYTFINSNTIKPKHMLFKKLRKIFIFLNICSMLFCSLFYNYEKQGEVTKIKEISAFIVQLLSKNKIRMKKHHDKNMFMCVLKHFKHFSQLLIY